MRHHHATTLLAAIVLLPGLAAAQSCLPFLARKGGSVGATVQLVTLNRNGVASSSQFQAVFGAAGRTPTGTYPAQWYTDDTAPDSQRAASQLFSDRRTGPSDQPFDVAKADRINVFIGIEESPRVKITLRSWGDGKVTFRATCTDNGVLHGSTNDVEYLLTVAQQVVK